MHMETETIPVIKIGPWQSFTHRRQSDIDFGTLKAYHLQHFENNSIFFLPKKKR